MTPVLEIIGRAASVWDHGTSNTTASVSVMRRRRICQASESSLGMDNVVTGKTGHK
jgi:hypothetical protein